MKNRIIRWSALSLMMAFTLISISCTGKSQSDQALEDANKLMENANKQVGAALDQANKDLANSQASPEAKAQAQAAMDKAKEDMAKAQAEMAAKSKN
ncbi:MAG: hypothetical protein OEV92_10060 [Nitrospinota bacterium]|nr:hypothetical protein [Nitrospinota bacterium]